MSLGIEGFIIPTRFFGRYFLYCNIKDRYKDITKPTLRFPRKYSEVFADIGRECSQIIINVRVAAKRSLRIHGKLIGHFRVRSMKVNVP